MQFFSVKHALATNIDLDSIQTNVDESQPTFWMRNSTYGPGDEVRVHTVGENDFSIYQCKELPFANYCGTTNPITTVGAEFWQLKTAESYLKAEST